MSSGRLQVYESDAVRVTFDPTVCQHSGVCLRTLPAVFDVSRKRWIRPELAGGEEVIAAVAKCPSGALQAHRITAVHQAVTRPPAATGGATRIRASEAGPLLVEGPFRIEGPDGVTLREGEKCSLCRCGASANKPFCDGSHRRIGFTG